MGRIANIINWVVNYVRKYDPAFTGTNRDEIASALTKAQNDIIQRCRVEGIVEITLVNGQSTYDLLINGRSVVGGVKGFILPSTYQYEISIRTASEWGDVITSSAGTTQPINAKITANQIEFYPVPNADYNSDIIKIICFLTASKTEITTATVDPELPPMFDELMEWKGASYFLSGEAQMEYEVKYENALPDKRTVLHNKDYRTKVAKGDW